MKSAFPLIFLTASILVSCCCGKPKKIAISIAVEDSAREHVKTFRKDYPNYIVIGNEKIPVSAYHTVYAVMFEKEKLAEHYPDLDFSEIIKRYPENASGIRIYQAVQKLPKKQDKFLNYLTYTVKAKENNNPDNDILGNVYLIDNHTFDLRVFRKSRDDNSNPHVLSHHLTCVPQCPAQSLFNSVID